MKLLGLSPELCAGQEMRDLFEDRAVLQAALDVEAALARAEAACGLIPAKAASTIAASCRAELYDLQAIAHGSLRAGIITIPLVKALTAEVARRDPPAASHVHLGATSQDIADTGLVLQLRRAVALVLEDGAALADILRRLASEHAATVMLGRTLTQPGPPITFGLKAAGWLGAVCRGLERVERAAGEALVLQFGGAVGTLSVLGDDGLAVSTRLAEELGLPLPEAPWHSHRDRLVSLACEVGILVGSLGKIGRDITLMMQFEVGEVAEPSGDGRGGSSTMPHKRNPVASTVALACANRAPGLVASLMAGLVQEHERATGAMQAEASLHAELMLTASGALLALREALEGLRIFPDAMRGNIARLRGLMFAERLALALSPELGRTGAHHHAEGLVAQALEEGEDLEAIAGRDPLIQAKLGAAELEAIFSPETYLGSTRDFVERTLARYPASTKEPLGAGRGP